MLGYWLSVHVREGRDSSIHGPEYMPAQIKTKRQLII